MFNFEHIPFLGGMLISLELVLGGLKTMSLEAWLVETDVVKTGGGDLHVSSDI